MMLKWIYVQQVFKESPWKINAFSTLDSILAEQRPEMVTVLSLDKDVDDSTDRAKVKYLGPLYMDWDCESIDDAIISAGTSLQVLQEMGLSMECVKLYATGGRGFHAEIPMETFMLKVPGTGITYLPTIYKEMAYSLVADGLDLKVYSLGRGRMWRTPNIKRSNGRYKVPITWQEFQAMTPELYAELTSKPRHVSYEAPQLCAELMALFDKSQEKVKARISKIRTGKPETAKKLAGKQLPSLDAMLDGRGIREGTGFQELAMQLAVTATAFGWSKDVLITKAQGLVQVHQSDGSRYATPKLRERELGRMFDYMQDNPCYVYSSGALRGLMNHQALDLDGLDVTKEDVDQQIARAEETDSTVTSDGGFDDLLNSIRMSRTGIFMPDETGSLRRICAVSFDDVKILRSIGDDTNAGKDLGYVCDVYIGGVKTARQTLDADIFLSLQSFNKFLSRYSQVCYGGDTHIKGIMMTVGDNARRAGRIAYVTGREGIDILQIPMHPDPELREPFMVWADSHGVVISPQHKFAERLNMEFAGYPDPRGIYQTDLSMAEDLAQWLEDSSNKQVFKDTLTDMLQFQSPVVVSKTVGWYISCFLRPLFHEVYGKFPLLHIYGDAGAGKTETNLHLLRLFYNHQAPKEITPGSTTFAMMQCLSGSASIPLLIDEYKPQVMGPVLHGKMRAMFRDAYNMKTVMRGGGSRENPSYMQVSAQQLAAPLVFVGEGAEDETAVMERVVAVNFKRPAKEVYIASKRRFERWTSNHHVLTLIGRWLVGEVLAYYTPERLKSEFQPMYVKAQQDYMLPEDRTGLSEDDLAERSKVNDRSVFNYTVSLFGLQKLKRIVMDVFEAEYEELFGQLFRDLEAGIYVGITSLSAMTMPEWAKVINTLALMSTHAEPDPAWALFPGKDYSVEDVGGQARLAVNARMCYIKYRTFCMRTGDKALFAGDQSFTTSLLGCPAFLERSMASQIVTAGGAVVLDIEQLSRIGVDNFKLR